jgi:hypothetical protein
MSLGSLTAKGIIGLIAFSAVTNTSPATSTAAQQPAPIATSATAQSWIVHHKETEGLIPDLRWRADAVMTEGNGRIKVGPNSAKRSREQQQLMIDLAASGQGAGADPIDESKHVTGEAIDFQVESQDVHLRADLCKKYGLKTTHSNELWHFELNPNRTVA